MTPIRLGDDNEDARRVRRDLDRLRALAERRRWRAVAMRAVRGTLGGGASFATLIKLKLAGSLVLKGALALIIGLCFAWPIILGAALALLLVVLAIASLLDGGGGGSFDCPCECWQASQRRDRLLELIEARTRWLDGREGPPPRVKGRATG